MVKRSMNRNFNPTSGGGCAVAVHCRRGTVRDGAGSPVCWSGRLPA